MTSFLFLIILIEGYVVLAAELLAIRLMVPFVGSGTEVISIIISAVLLPLAIGYHSGGRARQRYKTRPFSIRRILLKNIVSALFVFALGLSYAFLELFFSALGALGITHRLVLTAAYSLLFLVYPVYVLGQTVPLVSHYFSREKLSEITGRMLFFSTTGSFFGSVFSTIVLMSWLGVHITATYTLALLLVPVWLLIKHWTDFEAVLALSAVALAAVLNSSALMHDLRIVSNNHYNTISIVDLPNEESRILNVNRSASSKITEDPNNRFHYVRYIEDTFIRNLPAEGGPKDVLIIGAGGFTMGLDDEVNNYTFIDIDPKMKEVAERDFLERKLTPNKRFEPASARAFLIADKGQYDLIVVDTYTNTVSVPMECTTREFLQSVKDHLKPNGVVVVNMIDSPSFADRFSVRYHNTFASVFPVFTRQLLTGYNPWAPSYDAHAMYVYQNRAEAQDTTVYTDDRNTYSLDR